MERKGKEGAYEDEGTHTTFLKSDTSLIARLTDKAITSHLYRRCYGNHLYLYLWLDGGRRFGRRQRTVKQNHTSAAIMSVPSDSQNLSDLLSPQKLSHMISPAPRGGTIPTDLFIHKRLKNMQSIPYTATPASLSDMHCMQNNVNNGILESKGPTHFYR